MERISDNDSALENCVDADLASWNLTMAIEFDCPYCTATIRVPDAYGGKQGRCPSCDTRLLVPMIVRPGSTTVPDASSSPVTAGDSNPIGDAHSPADIYSIKPPASTAKRRPTARRRPSRALVIGMPVLCFLVLLAVIFFSVTGSLSELKGELAARRLEETTLPGVTIPWSDTGLSPEEQQTLRAFLETTPETLASEVMTCRLIGTDPGIEVRLTAGSGSDWFLVDTTTHKALALWLKKERPILNTNRLTLMRSSLVSYCRDKLAQIAGEALRIDAMSVRDNVAINACGGALSFAVQGEDSVRRVSCSYEDDKGMLYFCFPKETLIFKIVGRTLADGTKPFGGEFTAVISEISRPQADSVGTSKATPEGKKMLPADDLMPEPDSDSSEKESDKTMDSEPDSKKIEPSEPEAEMDMDPGMGSKKPSMKSDQPMMDGEAKNSEMMEEVRKPTLPKKLN